MGLTSCQRTNFLITDMHEVAVLLKTGIYLVKVQTNFRSVSKSDEEANYCYTNYAGSNSEFVP